MQAVGGVAVDRLLDRHQLGARGVVGRVGAGEVVAAHQRYPSPELGGERRVHVALAHHHAV
jgi:hypothetical protein